MKKSLLFLIPFIIALFVFFNVFNTHKPVKPTISTIFTSTPKFEASVKNEKEAATAELKSGGAGIQFTIPVADAKFSKKDNTSTFELPDATLQYEIKKDGPQQGLKETIILKNKNAPNNFSFDLNLENVDSFNPDPEKNSWHFFNKDGNELFYIPAGFMVDAKGVKSDAVDISITQKGENYTLKVSADKDWLASPSRAYPVLIDPSVIVSGGIAETEAQFGGNQRKLIYASSNWYAFYVDGTDVFYKKSSDGSSWGSAVDVDSSDADNINPSVYISGSLIYVAWIDTGSNVLEVNSINTASADALGTKCSSASPGTLASTYIASLAIAGDGTVYMATTDTAAGTVKAVYKLTFSGCSFTDISSTTGTETLRPNAAGDSTGIDVQIPASTSHYDKVDEAVADDATTRVYDQDGTAGTDYYALDNTGLTTETISSMDVVSRILVGYSGSGGGYAKAGVHITGQTDVYGSNRTSGAWTTHTETALAKPGGGSWAVGDLDGLQAAEQLKADYVCGKGCSYYTTNLTQIYINANWTRYYAANGSKPVLVTMGNNLHVISQDGNLSHSIYNGTSWTTYDTAIAAVTDSTFSATTDGTNIWVLSVSGTTGTNLYKYNGSWSSLTAPFTSQTNLTSASITYDSANSDLYASVIMDASEQAYYKSSDATSISWGSSTSLAFTAGDLGYISTPLSIAAAAEFGVAVRQGANFEFATVGAPTPTPTSAATPTPKVKVERGTKFQRGVKIEGQ